MLCWLEAGSFRPLTCPSAVQQDTMELQQEVSNRVDNATPSSRRRLRSKPSLRSCRTCVVSPFVLSSNETAPFSISS